MATSVKEQLQKEVNAYKDLQRGNEQGEFAVVLHFQIKGRGPLSDGGAG